MNKFLIIGVIAVALVAGGVAMTMRNSAQQSSDKQKMMQGKDTSKSAGSQDKTMKKEEMTQENETVAPSNIRYQEYSSSAFDLAKEKKRVYFFHAAWCPTCKAANEEFMANSSTIPEDIVLFKTDYDSEKDLKTRYAVTYQHTFVYVDAEGNEVAKWNGGGIQELIENVQ